LRLVLARPLERAITKPKEKREEKGVDFEGGEAGSQDNPLNSAIRVHDTV